VLQWKRSGSEIYEVNMADAKCLIDLCDFCVFGRAVAQPGRASESTNTLSKRRRCRRPPRIFNARWTHVSLSGVQRRNRSVAGSNPARPTKASFTKMWQIWVYFYQTTTLSPFSIPEILLRRSSFALRFKIFMNTSTICVCGNSFKLSV
jgi:hypothetical protein